MDIRQLSPAYAVSPQIEPGDVTAIADAGFKVILCNRPDMEVPPPLQAAAIGDAARAAGLAFVENPVSHPTIGPETIGTQMDVISQAGGPVLAYCASGTRSSILWALGQAPHMDAEDILSATGKAGYDLGGLLPTLKALAERG